MRKILFIFIFVAAFVGIIFPEPVDQEAIVRQIYDTADHSERLQLIDGYLALEEKDPHMKRYVYKAYFRTLQAMEDYNALEAILPDYLTAIGVTDGANAAEIYNMIAYAFAPSLKHLEMAEGYGRKALEVINAVVGTPQGINPEEWPAIKREFEANIRDTLGYILYRDMRYEASVEQLEKAVDVLMDKAVPRMHLGMAYEKTGNFKDAYKNLLSAKYLGAEGAELEEILERVGKKPFPVGERSLSKIK